MVLLPMHATPCGVQYNSVRLYPWPQIRVKISPRMCVAQGDWSDHCLVLINTAITSKP